MQTENLTNDQYKVLGSSVNIVYYCKFNSCASRVKNVIAEWTHTSSSIITSLKESHSKLSTEYEDLRKNLSDLSSKLDTLQSSESELQNHIKDTTTALSSVKMPLVAPTTSNATDIVDEYLDCERRKPNLIIYGIPESSGSTPDERKLNDKTYFTDLVHSEFKLDNIEITKFVRLGKQIEGKIRPLLVTLMDSYVRGHLLRNAKTLRNSSSHQNVYISPDLTPKEREINKLLREQLRRRKEAGESDLIIRRGKIVSKLTSTHATAHSTDNQK